MVVLSAEQARAWDNFTMENEPIAPIDLMERAAEKCVGWLELNNLLQQQQFYIFCGKGNNGGDGLAIARLLHEKQRPVDVFILEFGHLGTQDFQQNLQRLHALPVNIHFLQPGAPLPDIPEGIIIIDALLGTGLNRPAEGRMAELIGLINGCSNSVISIDMPSGMFSDAPTLPGVCVKASVTLSFQCYKTALLMAENAPFFGQVEILDIGLSPHFIPAIQPLYEIVDLTIAASILKPRAEYSHKGNFGHALLMAGSHGKMGAAILAARACLSAGAGLLTSMVPETGLPIIQSSVPEAMAMIQGTDIQEGKAPDLSPYRSIGCGPGIGTNVSTASLLEDIIRQCRQPMVWDADALNLLSNNPGWLSSLPPFSILTPHPKEFDRLTGPHTGDFSRLQKAVELAKQYQLIILLKGHRSFIAMPGGRAWFNFSGNASMAKGGSGDVLTGMLTGLLARGYAPEQAALLGVYVHGLAGELASLQKGMESVLAGDIIQHIGNAFIQLQSIKNR